jgi:hypothetical protein
LLPEEETEVIQGADCETKGGDSNVFGTTEKTFGDAVNYKVKYLVCPAGCGENA